MILGKIALGRGLPGVQWVETRGAPWTMARHRPSFLRNHDGRWTLRAAILVVALGPGLMASIPAAAGNGYQVQIVGNTPGGGYQQDAITVNPGDSVTWTNQDPSGAPHNAYCRSGDADCTAPFTTNLVDYGKTAGTVVFQYSGDYTYHCAAHGQMTGHVHVTGDVHPPSGASNPSSSGTSTG